MVLNIADFEKVPKSLQTPWNASYILANGFLSTCGIVSVNFGWIRQGRKLADFEQKAWAIAHGFEHGRFGQVLEMRVRVWWGAEETEGGGRSGAVTSLTCILFPSLSQTTILPSGSMPTPVGHWNWPLPSPFRPNWNRKPPWELNTWTRWLWQSVTTIRPSSSTATPKMPLNSPISVPFLPNFSRDSPELITFTLKGLPWMCLSRTVTDTWRREKQHHEKQQQHFNNDHSATNDNHGTRQSSTPPPPLCIGTDVPTHPSCCFVYLFVYLFTYLFVPCGQLDFESTVTAQNGEFKGCFHSSPSRSLSVKTWPGNSILGLYTSMYRYSV